MPPDVHSPDKRVNRITSQQRNKGFVKHDAVELSPGRTAPHKGSVADQPGRSFHAVLPVDLYGSIQIDKDNVQAACETQTTIRRRRGSLFWKLVVQRTSQTRLVFMKLELSSAQHRAGANSDRGLLTTPTQPRLQTAAIPHTAETENRLARVKKSQECCLAGHWLFFLRKESLACKSIRP